MPALKIPFPPQDLELSAIYERPRRASHLLVLAHGAGAGMDSRGMEALAVAMHAVQVATLRYNLPYMERGKRPDRPAVATAAVRVAVDTARKKARGLPLLAGGKSFGGRMTSTADSEEPLGGVDGLVFFGWPLHAIGKPGWDRAAHLAHVKKPMLFLQGTRDKLAAPELMATVCKRLRKAHLAFFEGADHSFHVLKKSGRTDAGVLGLLGRTLREWLDSGMKGGRSGPH